MVVRLIIMGKRIFQEKSEKKSGLNIDIQRVFMFKGQDLDRD